jgi:hypothetical protein
VVTKELLHDNIVNKDQRPFEKRRKKEKRGREEATGKVVTPSIPNYKSL